MDKVGHWLNTNRTPSPQNFHQRIPIYTPYHAPHLYSDEDVARILGFSLDSPYEKISCEAVKARLVSPVTGKYYQASSSGDLLKNVLHDVLKAPIEWTNLTAGCANHVAALEIPDWVVRAYGPTLAAGSLVSALKKGAQVEALLDGTFASSDPAQRGVPTNEPIAIVGMAGRFPEAGSHDELWELLEKGMDCAKVVCIIRVTSKVCTL